MVEVDVGGWMGVELYKISSDLLNKTLNLILHAIRSHLRVLNRVRFTLAGRLQLAGME